MKKALLIELGVFVDMVTSETPAVIAAAAFVHAEEPFGQARDMDRVDSRASKRCWRDHSFW